VTQGRDLYKQRLQDCLDRTADLRRRHNVHSSEFRVWQDRTEQTLAQLFGDRHPYVRRFSNMHFCLPRVSIGMGPPAWADEDQEVYERDFTEAESLLRDALEEIGPAVTGGHSMFDALLKDQLTLTKPNGDRIEGIRASVQRNKIFIADKTLPVSEGDILERTLHNGQVERFEVLAANFYDDPSGHLGHYELDVQKATARRPSSAPHSITNILHGANARVNISSVDQSVNVAGDLFADMGRAIEQGMDANAERQAILAKLSELEQAKGKPSFVQRYSEFMALAANHVTVLQPFLAALAQLLVA